MIVGNDISRWQQAIDWDIYKNNSNFCIIKVSEGVGFVDPKFSQNQSGGRRVNLPLGYYHFARPDLGNSAKAEANFFLSGIGELREGEVLCLDYEPNWNGDAVNWCKDFLNEVFIQTKCKPLIYLNQSQVKTKNWTPVVNEGYGLWIAAYTYNPMNNTFVTGSWPSAAMQQWTNRQTVPGIGPIVDGNVFFGDVVAFKKYGFHKPIVVPTPSNDIETLKQEISVLQTALNDEQTAHALDLANAKAECQTKLGKVETGLSSLKVIIEGIEGDIK